MTVQGSADDAVAKAAPSLFRKAELGGLGLLLACVAAIAWSGWYVGPPMRDRTTDSELRVLTAQLTDGRSLVAEADRALIREGKLKPVATRWLWTGTLRIFAVYRSTWAAPGDLGGAIASGFENLKKWERRRGVVLLTDEQPVQVGTLLFAETEPRLFTQAGWTHLRQGYSSARLLLAAVVGCAVLAAYAAARLLYLLLAAAYAFVATGAIPSWAARFED